MGWEHLATPTSAPAAASVAVVATPVTVDTESALDESAVENVTQHNERHVRNVFIFFQESMCI